MTLEKEYSNIWIEANAGTGKTTLLVDSILEHLKKGASCERIVCLTYTRLAACEIKLRLLEKLKTLDNFYTLPWVETIHAFCWRKLSLPNKRLLDTDMQTLFINKSIQDLLAYSEKTGGILCESLTFLRRNISERILFISLQAWLQQEKRESLFLPHNEAVSCFSQEEKLFSYLDFQRAAFLFQETDLGKRLNVALTDNHCAEVWHTVWMTQEDTARKIITRAMRAINTSLVYFLEMYQKNYIQKWEEKQRHRLYEMHHHFLKLALALQNIYTLKKEQEEVHDFTDILYLMQERLANDAGFRYDLDQTIDHIFIDEAQDLSLQEWLIIEKLIEEWFSGLGTRYPQKRSLFVVGDLKQSIFSFQGACPEAFLDKKALFRHKFEEAQLPWIEKSHTLSYRTPPTLLHVIDRVIESLSPSEIFHQKHESYLTTAKSFLEVWELDTGEKAEEILCQRLVSTIHKLLREIAIQPSDILILFQSRTPFWNKVNAALFEAQLVSYPQEHTPIYSKPWAKAALAYARFIMNIYDDYALATLLHSPFFGLSEENIFFLCHQRRVPLIERLAQDNPPLYQKLEAQVSKLASMSPSFFFSTILETLSDVQKESWPHFTQETEALLDHVLLFEQHELPFLSLFLEWISTRDTPLKQDAYPGDVRLMTVHAAKGLEASFVFLLDTLRVPTFRFAPPFLPGMFHPFPFAWNVGKKYENKDIKDLKEQWLQKEKEEGDRLLYVSLTRAKRGLYMGGCAPTRIPSGEQHNWYNRVRPVAEAIGKPGEREGHKLWRVEG